ncbi:MAG: Trehalose utilization [Phycisphaerales bacterium]|nr:Trehalose utilization [Phycisphaerales bacterium]
MPRLALSPALRSLLWTTIALLVASPAVAAEPFKLTARTRTPVAGSEKVLEVVEKSAEWAPAETALVICDMWDTHGSPNAAARTAALAPRIDQLAKAVRAAGGLVIHAPSDTMKFYDGTPQRRRAQAAPAVPPPSPPNRAGGPPLPIDDTDGGYDDVPPVVPPDGSKGRPWPWTRQIATIEVAEPDAITDRGDEVYNLLRQRGAKHLLVCGVHANMCVLHRSFGIKQMTRWGVDCALVRDCTDALYNPAKPPFVSHDKGTDLVVEYVERYWCPSVTSGQILGDAKPPKVLLVSGEQEYDAKATLPAFAKAELEPAGFAWQHLNSDDPNTIPGLEAMDGADVLVLFLRRRTLPPDQLARFKAWFEAGKPVVAVRTASHGFQTYLEFDRQVLGGTYGNHYKGEGVRVTPAADPAAAANPLLRGVPAGVFAAAGTLYKSNPLAATAAPLLNGTFADKPAEPVAWTNVHRGGRVFYTSLGHPGDFANPSFRTLLRNAVLWAADRPVPAGK